MHSSSFSCIRAGPKSFEELRTVDGILHHDFKSACAALGLLCDDQEHISTLQDASVMQSGTSLHHLFIIILVECQPESPLRLWDQFKSKICDDLDRRIQHTPSFNLPHPTDDDIYDYGLWLMQDSLAKQGKTLAEFDLPSPSRDWIVTCPNCPLEAQRVPDHVHEELRLKAQGMSERMNRDQHNAFTTISNSIVNGLGHLFFLNGPGGTGKTFVYTTTAHRVRAEGGVILCVASSGIAAILLPKGATAHSTFKIPVANIHGESVCSITVQSDRAELIRQALAIIWDEVPMQHRWCAEAVDQTCRDIQQNLPGGDHPFGGLTVVFGGDFRQCLPVIQKGKREDIVGACLTCSRLWSSVTILHLKQNMRLGQSEEDQRFATWLLDVGDGKNLPEDGNITLPPEMKVPSSLEDLISATYPDISQYQNDNYFQSRTILSTRNDDVDDINQKILHQFPGQEKTFWACDSIKESEGNGETAYTPEYLSTLSFPGVPLSRFKVKMNAPVMLLRNLDPEHGLCNGTRLRIISATKWVLHARILSGEHAGKMAFLPCITLHYSDGLPFTLSRLQFPVRLAFSMTINKSQGQSVWFVGIDLRSPVFTHGQLYVALSRATSSSRVKVLLPQEEAGTVTKNVVYKEALLT